MDILDDIGVSKLSAKVFFHQNTIKIKWNQIFSLCCITPEQTSTGVNKHKPASV